MHWIKVAPKEGKSETRMFKGNEYKWYAKCKRWTTGSKLHSTDEHRSRRNNNQNSNNQGNVAQGEQSSNNQGHVA